MTRVRRGQVALSVIGSACLAVGAQSLVGTVTSPEEVLAVGARWAGAAVLVDLALVPLAGAIGLGLRRALPRRWFPLVAAGMAVSFLVTVVAVPFLAGTGRRAGNPSLLDRPYLSGWLVLVAVGWIGAALSVRWGRRGRVGR